MNTYFKLTIDIFYFLLCFSVIGVIFILPLNSGIITMNEKSVANWGVFSWVLFLSSLVSFSFMLYGAYLLRKIASCYISDDYFSETIVQYLKTFGTCFLISANIMLVIILCNFIAQLVTENDTRLILNYNLLFVIFLQIIGSFFWIQSNALKKAIQYKYENDLTI